MSLYSPHAYAALGIHIYSQTSTFSENNIDPQRSVLYILIIMNGEQSQHGESGGQDSSTVQRPIVIV